MAGTDGELRFGTKLDTDGISSGLSKVGSLTKASMAAVGAGVAAAATAMGALTKASVEAYASFEQLEGGAELMFGEAYDFVMAKSKEAYKNVQMSQNDYLEQVNGFATGLKTAMGGNTQAAAELADKIITAEADVVAATGTSQEAVQNAFNGIMKSNYTMLDNLQLGIKPTKEGMQEVIDKVNEWNAANGKATSYQLDNLADCQAALVDYIEMQGMSGYAAAEAAGTITGSYSMVKASWEDLTAGLSNPDADLGPLIDNFIESAKAFGKNVLPIVKEALEGISQLISEMLPVIAAEIPSILNTCLPGLLDAGADIVIALLNGIVSVLPQLVPVAVQIILKLVDALVALLPQILEAGIQVIVSLALGIADALPQLIPTIVQVILQMVETLLDNMDLLIDAAIQLIMGLTEGLINALPILIEKMPEIIIKMCNALVNNSGRLAEAAGELIVVLGAGLIKAIPTLVKNIPKIIQAVFTALTVGFSAARNIGVNLIEGLWNGIADKTGWIVEKIKGFGNKVMNAMKEFFGIHSPSRKFKWIGEMCIEGFEQPFDDYDPYAPFTNAMKASAGTMSASIFARGAGSSTTTQTFNIYQPVKSPSDMMRAARLEWQYRLVG